MLHCACVQVSLSRSFTLLSISGSYETVASILGPSSSTLVKVDRPPRPIEAVTSMDAQNKTATHSDEFVPHDNTAPTQKVEGHVEDLHSKHDTEHASSAGPITGDQVSPLKTNSEDELVVGASVNKLPPLTEGGITKTSIEDDERAEGREVDTKVTGQDSVHIGCLLAQQQAEEEQDEVKTMVSLLQLDKW